jgi:hypothetical protein
MVRQTFQLVRCGCTFRQTSETLHILFTFNLASQQWLCRIPLDIADWNSTNYYLQDERLIRQYREETEKMRTQIKDLKTRYVSPSHSLSIRFCSHCLFPVVDKSGISCYHLVTRLMRRTDSTSWWQLVPDLSQQLGTRCANTSWYRLHNKLVTTCLQICNNLGLECT